MKSSDSIVFLVFFQNCIKSLVLITEVIRVIIIMDKIAIVRTSILETMASMPITSIYSSYNLQDRIRCVLINTAWIKDPFKMKFDNFFNFMVFKNLKSTNVSTCTLFTIQYIINTFKILRLNWNFWFFDIRFFGEITDLSNSSKTKDSYSRFPVYT